VPYQPSTYTTEKSLCSQMTLWSCKNLPQLHIDEG
jgi:hypothetical protein